MVISKIYCNFIVLKYKEIQTKIAMITEDKITEIYCMADDFCKVFDAQMKKYTIQPQNKRKYHRVWFCISVIQRDIRFLVCHLRQPGA